MKPGKLITILFLFSCLFTNAENYTVLMDSANSAYSAGRYKDAITMYEQIIAAEQESPALYFNLGNAWFKTNNIGAAILNYERAKKLDPDDEDIEANLKLANQKTEDKIDAAPQLFFSQWENGVTDLMNEKEWSMLLIALIVTSLSFFLLYIFSSAKGARKAGFFGGSLLMITALFTFFIARSRYESTINGNSAIIMSGSVTVTGSPSEKGTKLFILHEGTKVVITETNEDWTEIKIANGNVGWVKNNTIEKI